MNAPFAKIALKVLPYQFKIEIGLTVIFLLSLLLKSFSIPAGQLVIISLGSLSALYVILSFKDFSTKTKWYHSFTTELIYKSFSILLISLLFIIMRWPGGNIFLMAGTGSLIVGNIVTFIVENNNDSNYDFMTDDIVRSLIIFFLCGLFLAFY